MAEARCPHCHTALPEEAIFCAACGRRILGWAQPAAPAASPTPVPPPPTVPEAEPALPSDEAPTRQMEPTPSLLKLVREGKRPSPRPRRRRASPLALAIALVLVAGAAAMTGFVGTTLHRRWRERDAALAERAAPPAAEAAPAASPKSTAPDAPTLATAPPAPTKPAPPAKPALANKSALAKPAPTVKATPAAVAATPRRAAHRLAAMTVPARNAVSARAGGALPHKQVSTDSRGAAAAAPAAAPAAAEAAPAPPASEPAAAPPAAAPAAAPTSEVGEAPARTDAEVRNEAEASIDADGVRFVVRSHLAQVHACYERAFKDSSPGGRVEVALAIDPEGHARRVRAEVNTTGSEPLAHCLEAHVREWQFPRPVGGDYELIYPFVFAPGS